MATLLWILAIAAALFGIDRLALRAERRGWIYWRHRKASPGTAAGAMLEVQSLLEPGKRHVLESTREAGAESDAAGDPPPDETAR